MPVFMTRKLAGFSRGLSLSILNLQRGFDLFSSLLQSCHFNELLHALSISFTP